MDNLEIYNQFREVPAEAKKTIQAGKLKGFTDINPMWRIKKLTERFGPCGYGWKTSDVTFHVESAGGETAVFCSLNLFVKNGSEWSEPIFGIGGSKLSGKGVGDGINDEAHKMAFTDALSIACKNLGMAADIYFANDRTKYNSVQEQPSQAMQARRAAKAAPIAAQAYEPLPEETYWKVVKAHARGAKTKTGGDYRQSWIDMTHATKEAIAKFDNDVINRRAAMMEYQDVSPAANQEVA